MAPSSSVTNVLRTCASVWVFESGSWTANTMEQTGLSVVRVRWKSRGESEASAVAPPSYPLGSSTTQGRYFSSFFFFPPALIFLEPAAEYWAQFVCVCGVESAYMRLPSSPRAQPMAHLWAAGKVNKHGKKNNIWKSGHTSGAARWKVAESPQDVGKDSDNESYFHQLRPVFVKSPSCGW